MITRLIAALILSASIIAGSVANTGFPVTYFPDGFKMLVDFAPASYDSYELTLADGVSLNMKISGDRVIFKSDTDRSYDINLSKCSNSRTVRNFYRAGESFDVELASSMNQGDLYNLTLTYECFGQRVTNSNNIIFKTGKELFFWKSSKYEFNTESCSELWTDEQSLKECLEPQNDVECDDPVLIAYSDRICKGAEDDWEKVFRIYDYIAHELYYDNIEADNDSGSSQDGAVDVLRDGKGICEGFSNAFAALCRAQGIPAVVEFGLGYADYNEMITREYKEGEYADHAWAAVFLGGKWLFVDPTYDAAKFYNGSEEPDVRSGGTNYYLMPLESFSNDHLIMDADTRHGIPSSGYCGHNATYEITRDGVCYISGAGKIKMPAGVNGFHKIVFTENCKVNSIEKDCFDDCDLITTVILPDTVMNIREGAFKSCEDLEYVYIPEGCKTIGTQAFDYCDELSYVRIPDSVTTIDSWAFDDCPRLYISVPAALSDFAKEYDVKPMYIEKR